MRILITGITGFVGRRLARLLVEGGDEVAGTYVGDRPTPRGLPEGIPTWEADVLDCDAVADAIEAADPEAVIHLAGLSHVGRSWDAMGDYFRVNVLGSDVVLDLARGRRVVVASSAEVYGAVAEEDQPLSEDRLPAPASPYALTKAAMERLAIARGAVVVRSFNLLGPGQAPSFALPSFARQLARIAAAGGRGTLSVGNLEARRDFLHVDDAAAAYRLVAERGEPGGTYNLGSGDARSIRQVLDLLLEVSGVDAGVKLDPERLRPVDVALLMADAGRLRALGWEPLKGLRQAMEDLWEEARAEVAGG